MSSVLGCASLSSLPLVCARSSTHVRHVSTRPRLCPSFPLLICPFISSAAMFAGVNGFPTDFNVVLQFAFFTANALYGLWYWRRKWEKQEYGYHWVEFNCCRRGAPCGCMAGGETATTAAAGAEPQAKTAELATVAATGNSELAPVASKAAPAVAAAAPAAVHEAVPAAPAVTASPAATAPIAPATAAASSTETSALVPHGAAAAAASAEASPIAAAEAVVVAVAASGTDAAK